MEVFCGKCHRLAAVVIADNEGTKVMQNGKSLLNIKGQTKMNDFSIKCPQGHPVKIKV